MSLLLAHALVSFFHLIMKLVMLLLLIFRSSTPANVSVGEPPGSPREPREGPEHLGRRRVPSNNRYSGKVESPSSSCLPSERLSGKPGGPGAPRPSRHRYVPRLVPRDVLEARSGRLGRPRGDEDGLRNVAGEAGGPFCAERRASSSRAERQASSLHCPVHPIKGLLIGRFLPIFTDFSDFLGRLLVSLVSFTSKFTGDIRYYQ